MIERHHRPPAGRQPRRLSAHRESPVNCPCGRIVPRKSRQQKFCSARCAEQARERCRKALLTHDTGAPANPPKKPGDFNALQGGKSWSSTGISAPSRAIYGEVFAGREWREVTSRDSIKSMVAAIGRAALVRKDGGAL